MLLEIPAIFCIAQSKKKCCLCCKTKRALSLLPLADAFEFVITVAFTLTIYFAQDT
jgi:hypothetical protein